MGRKKRGKLNSLTPKDKLAKRVRNEQRKRTPSIVKWEKQHVVPEGFQVPTPTKTKRQRREEAVVEALAEAVRHAAEDGMLEAGNGEVGEES